MPYDRGAWPFGLRLLVTATYQREADGSALVQTTVVPGEGVHAAVRAVLAVTTAVGHPTVEVRSDDGLLSLSTDGEPALLVLSDPTGTSRSSAGSTMGGPVMVFDHRGAWSEADSSQTVPLPVAVDALTQYVEQGRVRPDLVPFTDD